MLDNDQLVLAAFLNPKYKKFSKASNKQKKKRFKKQKTFENFIKSKLNEFKDIFNLKNQKLAIKNRKIIKERKNSK